MSAKKIVMISMLLSLHGPAFADAGNPAEGDKLFRNCQACHTLTGPNGEKLRTGGRVGPNLYGIVGRAAGGLEGYNFSPGLKALNTSGLIWTEEALTAFIRNPNAYLEAQLGSGHTSKMPFGLPKGAADIASYLAIAK